MFLCIGAAAGCRTVPTAEPPSANAGDVGLSLLMPPPGASRLEPASTERFVYPNLIAQAALPEYPPHLLPLRLPPVTACVEVDIDEDGGIIAARQRIDDEACPGAVSPPDDEFATAALRTVQDWSYDPAYLCQAPEGFDGDDPCLAEDMVERPTSLRLSYAFRFSQHDGEPLVERKD